MMKLVGLALLAVCTLTLGQETFTVVTDKVGKRRRSSGSSGYQRRTDYVTEDRRLHEDVAMEPHYLRSSRHLAYLQAPAGTH